MRSVYWIRNDLRFHDNRILNQFCKKSEEGVFVWYPSKSFLRAGQYRRDFILGSLIEFKSKVEKLGGKIFIFKELAETHLPQFLIENKIESLFFEDEIAFEEVEEQKKIVSQISNIKIYSRKNSFLFDPEDLPFLVSNTPNVFTDFRKKLEANWFIRSEVNFTGSLPSPFAVQLELNCLMDLNSEKKYHPRILPGEEAALLRLKEYIWLKKKVSTYKETRNGMIEWNDSTKLSPYLSIGLISPVTIYTEILKYEEQYEANDSTYWVVFELLWRDYFKYIFLKDGKSLFLKKNRFSNRNLELLEQWIHGETPSDFINANMIELKTTGWMSNRGRQNVASYLAKTLQVEWQLGAEYFERVLIDYDVSSNWGNWAYLAGVGQDPRDRMFNVERQAHVYDPNFEYRKRWLK